MFQTDSDKDVIFVSITIDQAKRLALQRDIDQESQPKQSAKTLTSHRSVAVERPEGKVKMKMEDVKKEKKQKTGQACLPKNKNCTVDDGSLAGVKKVKRVEAVVEEEQSWDGGGEKEDKKKKKKKGKVVTDSLNDANGSDVTDGNDEGACKKKTKKKQLAEYESGPGSVKEDGEEKRQRKEKKVKNKASQIQPEHVKMEKIEKEGEKVQKKVKKEKNKILVASTEETEEHIKERKKKKNNTAEEVGINVTKKKAKLAENGVQLETPEVDSDEVEEVRVKRKKKKQAKTEHKAATEEDENEVETQEIKGNKKKNKAALGRGKPEAAIKEEMEEKDIVVNKRKDKCTKSEIVIIEEGKTKSKKKGEKEKRRNALEVSETEETEPTKKKRKKANLKGEEPLILKCEEVEEEGQSIETLVTEAGDTSKKSKKKKSSSKVETQVENVCFETGAKKKKKNKKIKEEVEDQHESPQVDVIFLSEKTGNTDEVTINQERRQALQIEIDKASQPQKPATPSGFGQWSTAQFNSSEQQQKFLRLMGGFKRGFQPAAASTGGANMALGKDGQQQLQQGLLGDFERAQSRRMDFGNRGAGLGFTAPSNKKFSIDVDACRSVRFDN